MHTPQLVLVLLIGLSLTTGTALLQHKYYARTVRRLASAHDEAGWRKTTPRIQKQTSSPEKVAAAVERALTDEKPRARYLVGPDAYVQLGIPRVLPPRARDGLSPRLVGVPR